MESRSWGSMWAGVVAASPFQGVSEAWLSLHGKNSFQVDKLQWGLLREPAQNFSRCQVLDWVSVRACPPCSLDPRDQLDALISAHGWHRETQQLQPLSGASDRAGIGSGTCLSGLAEMELYSPAETPPGCPDLHAWSSSSKSIIPFPLAARLPCPWAVPPPRPSAARQSLSVMGVRASEGVQLPRAILFNRNVTDEKEMMLKEPATQKMVFW